MLAKSIGTLFCLAFILSCDIPLEGVWLDVDNENNLMILERGNITIIHDNDTISTGQYSMQKTSCDLSYADKSLKSDFVIFKYLNEDFCYEITSLSDSILVFRSSVNGKLYKYFKEGYSKPSFGPDKE